MIELFFVWIFPAILCRIAYKYMKLYTPFTIEKLFSNNKNYFIAFSIARYLPIVNIVLLIMLFSILISNYFRKR